MKKECLLSLLLLITLISCKTEKNNTSETVINNYIEEMSPVNSNINRYLSNNYFKMNSSNESVFIKKIDSLKNIYTRILSRYKSSLDETLFNDEILTINSIFYQKILEYPERHKKFTGKNITLSKKNQARINKFSQNFNDHSLLSNNNFRRFVKSFISIESTKKLKSKIYYNIDNQQLHADWSVIETLFKNQETNDFWKQEYLYNHIDNMGIKNIDSIYTSFIKTCKKNDYTIKIGDIYNQHKKARASHRIETYKKVDNFNLEIHLFLPDTTLFKGNRPTIVQFHGGSWSIGKPDWFFGNAKEYAKKGWVVAVVEYRIKGKQGTYPFDAVKDAKSSIRWLRENSERLKINPNKILATGNSAGGHLALATSLVANWNEKTDNLATNAKPNTLIVNSAVYDLTDNNTRWVSENLENKNLVKEISPNLLTQKTTTKMLLIHGDKDTSCPYSSATSFYQKMKSLGNNIEFHTIKDATHMIWFGKHSSEVSNITQDYLQRLNYK